MESEKKILCLDNYQAQIPTILKNLKELDYSSPNTSSVCSKLATLAYPSKDELEYLFYAEHIKFYISQYLDQNKHLFQTISKYGLGNWTIRAVFDGLVFFYAVEESKKDKTIIPSIFKDSESVEVLLSLVRTSAYTGIDCLNHLVNKQHYDLQMIAVDICDIEDLKKLTKSPYDKVRLSAYKRLGPMQYIDEMLLDKSRHVRSCAAGWMPHGYEVPTKALSDRAYWSFAKILEKVSLLQIPMLLGNKKLSNNRHLSERLQNRLDSKF